MSSPTERSLLESWRQGWPLPGTIFPYVVLAVSAASATTSQWGSVSVNLTLCAVAAVWMLIPLHPALRKRIPVMAVFLAGIIAITAVLVVRDPWFGFLVTAGYGYSIRLIPWPWSLPSIGAMAVLAATSQMWGVNKATPVGLAAYLAVIAMNIMAVCGIAWFMHSIEQAHDKRKRMLDELSEANRKLETTLAENEGLHRQLLTQAREAGILDERQRMAREIHDTLAQGLAGIVTQLQAAEQAAERTPDDPSGWRRHFAAATRLARESLTEARRSVDALRPEPLETARLSDALAAVAANWSALHGTQVQVSTTGTARPIQPEAEAALLRAAQEALANVAKHAEANRVGLTLSYMDNEVALDIRDDGKGFSTEMNGHPATGGFGLVAMRQRIQALSGTLQIESEPGMGTAISATVPISPAVPASATVPASPAVPASAASAQVQR
ncbi:MAG TPA: sensor histidine kinase [Streptosporangiaceae bacterium]